MHRDSIFLGADMASQKESDEMACQHLVKIHNLDRYLN